MKTALIFLLTCTLLSRGAEQSGTAQNQLTPEEQAAGWALLFDGKSLDGWRNFGKATPPQKGWTVREDCLTKVAKVRGGDIITTRQFDNFDLQWDWRIPPRGNSGVKYFITEKRGSAVGHEYQMIDDTLVKNPKGQTASFYDVLPPAAEKPLHPPGQWNHSRVMVQGNHVEHWLNGAKVLEYELGSPQVLEGVARSKFKSVQGFGRHIKGHILLTDHTDEAFFRNIKIRELPAR